MYVFGLVRGRRCFKSNERPLESAEQGTCIRGLCLEIALCDGFNDPSEQLRRLAGDVVIHVTSVARGLVERMDQSIA
jgi:hypothetical protein